MLIFTVKTGKHLPKKQEAPKKDVSIAEGLKSLDKAFSLYLRDKYDGRTASSAAQVMDMVEAIDLEQELYNDFRAFLVRKVGTDE